MILINNTASSAVDTEVTNVTVEERSVYRIVQVEITAAGVVLIQGRLSSNMPWHTIETITTSDAKSIALFPHMRVSLSGNTGFVSVYLDM